mgnify:CR=1 FL=1
MYADLKTLGYSIGHLAPNGDFYKKEDWPEIYAFFKKHLKEFDVCYQEFNDILITLVD